MQVIRHNRHAVNIGTAERWASVIAGGVLIAMGVKRRSGSGIAAALLGGDLIRRGITGHCYLYEAAGVRTQPRGQGDSTSVPYELGVRVDQSVTIGKPREEVYRFWRDFSNLPRFMKHLESARVTEEGHSHWVAKGPAGRKVEWDAVIHNEVPHELIAWRSLPGSSVENAGSVLFKDAPGGRGTEVKVELQYNPPAGMIGAAVAYLFGEEPSHQIKEDLHRLKQLLETGEVPTIKGQTSGREVKGAKPVRRKAESEMQRASEASFPASDAPAYNHQ